MSSGESLAAGNKSHCEIIVSVKQQRLLVIDNQEAVAVYPVSTSKFGTGDRQGSYATPLGTLNVQEKIGDGAPLGTVFKSRQRTGEILPPNAKGRDPIVTRIIWLSGKEDRNRNSFARFIYIHGTPQESLIGKPASYGCIRMKSADVAALYDLVDVETPVRIIAEKLPALATVDGKQRVVANSTNAAPSALWEFCQEIFSLN